MKNLYLIILLYIAFSAKMYSYDFYVKDKNYTNIYYTITCSESTNRTVEVAWGPEKYPRPITIPSTVTYSSKKYKVTGIGKNAFQGCIGVTSITIPNSITYIDKQAFENTGLTNIDIPESVTQIGSHAFSYNENLETVSFPNSITSVGGTPFYKCEKLSHSIYNNKIFVLNVSEDTTLVVPEGITMLVWGATYFRNRYGSDTPVLKKVVLPSTIDSLDYASIYGSNISNITVKAATPPRCSENSILAYGDNVTVYVSNADPSILEAYKADPYWSNFNIVATDLSGGDDPKGYVDVNGDDAVNGADVVSVYNYIQSGESSQVDPSKADVNGDNSVNGADAVSIYNYIQNGSNPR